MSRHNRARHPRCIPLTDRYDLDYVNLPEHPNWNRIVVRPLKTIYINLDAAFDADDFYVARSFSDPILRRIAGRIEYGGAL